MTASSRSTSPPETRGFPDSGLVRCAHRGVQHERQRAQGDAMNADVRNSTWESSRDSAFFRITANLLPRKFVYGAGVMLASNDDEWAAIVPSETVGDPRYSH